MVTMRWLSPALVIAGAVLLACFASATPPALPADAPASRFSAGLALLDIARMAQVPHPIGSPQNVRVRDQLLGRLRGLGLQPRVQAATRITPWGEARASPYRVENVIAVAPGTDRASPAVLVMSHYDSVKRSPGAADDMAGVASALEIVRLLHQGPPPRRDVLFVFTDGEEAGLLGARAFFERDPAARRVGFVVNLEARGGGGRALMFQTGEAAAGSERLFAASAVRPQSESLAAYLYRKMPNDTDFSVALAHGLQGFNYAFIGRPALYHTPAATPAAVEPGAVQSLGEQAWTAVRAVTYAPVLPARGPDLVWFDVFGRAMAIYPPLFGWAPLAVAGVLLASAAWRRRGSGFFVAEALVGAGQSLGATVLAAVLLYGYGWVATTRYYPAMAHAWRTEVVIILAVLGASLLVLRAGGAARQPQVRAWGVCALAWLIGVTLQVAAPLTAFLAAWPVLLACIALAVLSHEAAARPARSIAAGLCCVVALGFLFEIWQALILAVGLLTPAIGASLTPLALAALAPVLLREVAASFETPLRGSSG